jgi:hypothetical protein
MILLGLRRERQGPASGEERDEQKGKSPDSASGVGEGGRPGVAGEEEGANEEAASEAFINEPDEERGQGRSDPQPTPRRLPGADYLHAEGGCELPAVDAGQPAAKRGLGPEQQARDARRQRHA